MVLRIDLAPIIRSMPQLRNQLESLTPEDWAAIKEKHESGGGGFFRGLVRSQYEAGVEGGHIIPDEGLTDDDFEGRTAEFSARVVEALEEAAEEINRLEERLAREQGGFIFIPADQVTGTADAIILSPDPEPTANLNEDRYIFFVEADNTGPVTVMIGSLPAVPLTYSDGSPLQEGALHEGRLTTITYLSNQDKFFSDIDPPSFGPGVVMGQPGIGIQFIYQLTAGENAPALAASTTTQMADDLYVPAGWRSSIISISETNPYLWISARRGSSGDWGEFDTPSLFARWAPDGRDGSVGAPGEQGLPGTHGNDGVGIEYIYQVTTNENPPADITTTTDQDGQDGYVPDGWTDSVVSTSSVNRWLWIATRRGSTGAWGKFSEPALLSIYPEDGTQGLPGNNGADGLGVEYVYRLTTSISEPPAIVTSEAERGMDDFVPTDWFDTPQDTSETNRWLWISQRRGSTGSWEEFSAPALLSVYALDGEDGEAGDPGRDGMNGRDGRGIEFVYRLTNSANPPASVTTTSGQRAMDDFVPVGWFDDPQAVSEDMQFHWMISRTGTLGAWGEFTDPVLLARWAGAGPQGEAGRDGLDGRDGVGIEFVYRLTAEETAPDSVTTDSTQRATDDFVPDDWSDDPITITSTMPFLWMMERRGSLGAWGEFTDPVLLARYPPDPPPGTPGTAGHDGTGFESVYRLTSSNVAPPAITTTSDQDEDDDHVPFGWHDSPQSTSPSSRYLWIATRRGTTEDWGKFSSPSLLSVYALDGQDGEDGEDGQPGIPGTAGLNGAGVEFVYRLTTSDASPPAITTNTNQRASDGFLPANWSGEPLTTDLTSRWLWISARTGSTGEWGEFSTPALLSVYALDGLAGINGEDGDPGEDGKGREYIFTRSNSEDLAESKYPSNDWGYDSMPETVDGQEWTDGASDLSESLPYLYRAEREIVGSPMEDAEVEAEWSEPVIVGRWGPQGVRGEKGDTGDAGRDGLNGNDGAGIEFIYTLTATEAQPTLAATTNEQRAMDDFVPDGWHDDPQSNSSDMPYHWIARRTGTLGSWGEFSDPALLSNFAEPGQPGEDGRDGTNGRDGRGIEFVYRVTSAEDAMGDPVPPPSVTTDATQRAMDDYVPDDWHDDPVHTSNVNKYLWIMQRTGTLGAWGEFTDPSLLSSFGDIGPQGPTGPVGPAGLSGHDGPGIEMVFRVTSTALTPDNITTSAAEDAMDDFVPTGWSDGPPDTSLAHPYLWVSYRKGSTGNWNKFSPPALFTRHSDKGDKGEPGDDKRWLPFEHGFSYRDRNQNSIDANGTWVAFTGSGDTYTPARDSLGARIDRDPSQPDKSAIFTFGNLPGGIGLGAVTQTTVDLN